MTSRRRWHWKETASDVRQRQLIEQATTEVIVRDGRVFTLKRLPATATPSGETRPPVRAHQLRPRIRIA